MSFLVRLRQPRPSLWFWQGVFVAGLVLPAFGPWMAGRAAPSSSLTFVASAASASALPQSGITIGASIVWLLSSGAVARVLWLTLGLIRLRRIKAHAESFEAMRPLSQRSMRNFFTEPTSGFGRGGWAGDIGVRRPVVLLRDACSSSLAVQRAILGHELIHVRRRDWVHTVAEEFWCAILWFHPAARVLASRLCLARESLVDQETIACTGDRRAYLEALLAFSLPQRRLLPATPFIRRRHLAERIALIAQEVTMSHRQICFAIGIAGAVVGMATVATIGQFPIATALAAQEALVPGKDVTLPQVLREVKPKYTQGGDGRKIQGSVMLRVVVLTSGDVGDVKIKKSLDSKFTDLNQEAIAAAKQWKFKPGLKAGQARARRSHPRADVYPQEVTAQG